MGSDVDIKIIIIIHVEMSGFEAKRVNTLS